MKRRTYYLLSVLLLVIVAGLYLASILERSIPVNAALSQGGSMAMSEEMLAHRENAALLEKLFSIGSYASALFFLLACWQRKWRGLLDYTLFTVVLFLACLLIKALLLPAMYNGLSVEWISFAWYSPRRPILYLILMAAACGVSWLARRLRKPPAHDNGL